MSVRDFTVGQYLPIKTRLHEVDPRLKIASALFLSVIIFLYNGKQLAVFAAAIAFLLLTFGLPLKSMLLSIRSVWVIVLITALLQFFLTPGKVILAVNFITITDAGLYNGIVFSSRIILLVILLSSVVMTTSPIRIADAIESLLRPLSSIGSNLRSLSTVVSIVLMFVPGTLERTRALIKAQMSRGAEFGSRKILKMVRNIMPVIIPLFIKSFRDAEELFLAMEARAYSPGMRTHLRPMKLRAKEFLPTIFLALAAIALKFLF